MGWVGLGFMCHPPSPGGGRPVLSMLESTVDGWVPRGRPRAGRCICFFCRSLHLRPVQVRCGVCGVLYAVAV